MRRSGVCRFCGVPIDRDDMTSAFTREEVWYDPNLVDVDNPALNCESGDYEGDPHQPVEPEAEYIEHPPCPDCNDTGDTEQGICPCPAGSALWAEYQRETA